SRRPHRSECRATDTPSQVLPIRLAVPAGGRPELRYAQAGSLPASAHCRCATPFRNKPTVLLGRTTFRQCDRPNGEAEACRSPRFLKRWTDPCTILPTAL